MNLADWITIKDIIYVIIGLIIGFIVSVIFYEQTNKLHMYLLLICGKAKYGTYIEVNIYNPIYDERDPMRFDNNGLNNGISTYEVNMPYRFIEEGKLDISLPEFDQQLIETINLKFKKSYSTRHTKLI
ncbi:hypothetical protein [Jeotgalicoccus sp. WY2]|uniref:hypothetical protein n=1 Tax=Jeotgalicoccus sp. WY2 TaxID=2708346 RepID=UPI001BD3ECB7|nr:hypothetical protein [Jeotgalicoccus sp. WY2]